MTGSSSRPPAAPSVPGTCLAACAVLHDLDGHAVVAHYGSVSGEIAVCMKSVGLADHSDYGVCELCGARELLDRALVARLGDPPPGPGSGRRVGDVWHLRLDGRHALLVGPHSALAAGAALGRRLMGGDLRHRDVGASLAIVGVVGPRAARLLAAAGLPGDLPIGAIATDASDGTVVAILRESQRRHLALVQARAADAFWARLLIAGEPFGAAFVGYDALTLLSASPVAVG
jgi:glycine cleavage system aminomethyltransferase T